MGSTSHHSSQPEPHSQARGESSGMLSFMEVFDVMADKIQAGRCKTRSGDGDLWYTSPRHLGLHGGEEIRETGEL